MTNGASSHVEKDIVFGRGGNIDLRLDVYHPTGPSKRTAIVHLHGGGFTSGAKENNELNCLAFAERGYTSITAEYRLASQGHWPDQLHDTKAAIRWARANAGRLGIDSDKIAVAGYSAGGDLALVAAGTGDVAALEGEGGSAGVSTRVAACIAYYASASRRRPEAREDPLMGPHATDEAYVQANGITYASTAVPTIFFHSVADDAYQSKVRCSYSRPIARRVCPWRCISSTDCLTCSSAATRSFWHPLSTCAISSSIASSSNRAPTHRLEAAPRFRDDTGDHHRAGVYVMYYGSIELTLLTSVMFAVTLVSNGWPLDVPDALNS